MNKKKQRCNVKNTHYNNALNLLRILFQMTKKTKRKGKKKKMMMENEKKRKNVTRFRFKQDDDGGKV